jgi:holdfast attachment protein HfaA
LLAVGHASSIAEAAGMIIGKTFMGRTRIRTSAVLCAGLALATVAGAASAQTMWTNSASFNAGYGRTSDQENGPVNIQMTDANGNLTVINGMVQNNSASIFAQASASASASGAADAFSGAGSSGGSASAIGNNLNVVTEGNNNIVIVNSTQTNTGDVIATTTTNGKQ